MAGRLLHLVGMQQAPAASSTRRAEFTGTEQVSLEKRESQMANARVNSVSDLSLAPTLKTLALDRGLQLMRLLTIEKGQESGVVRVNQSKRQVFCVASTPEFCVQTPQI